MAQQDLPFARDLGYLDKFLTSLRAHAEGLSEPQRSDLLQLVTAEVATWGRIRAILAGQAPPSAQAAPSATNDPSPAAAASAPRGLTVGSLMPGR